MLPRSPWEASLADNVNDGLPIDEKVELSFALIFDDLPTPQKIIFDWHFAIRFTAWLKELLIEPLSFF